jgi:hypothetical protein
MFALRNQDVNRNLLIGKIIEVDGTHIKAELDSSIDELSRVYNTNVYTIGQFGSIIKSHFGNNLLFMFVTRLRLKSDIEEEKGNYISPKDDSRIIEADLFGEGTWIIDKESSECKLKFERGVSTYPLPQQDIYLTTSQELVSIFDSKHKQSVKIGTYIGADNIPCYANIDELFSKHTAILGSTGSGKSATVAAVLHSVLAFSQQTNETGALPWHPHIIILDPHNEYMNAFPEAKRLVSDEGTLLLPYWLLNIQELIDLFIGKTEYQATSQTNILKKALIECRSEACEKIHVDSQQISVDSPIPFSLEELINKIKADMPPQASKQDKHLSIITKIEMLKSDRRLDFLMKEWDGTHDPISEVISQFITCENSLKVIDLSGMPNDVAGTLSATISRLLFMYKLWEQEDERKNDPILLVCEEAHRYVPNKGEAEYAAAQDAIKRIAKEGRKYGIGLMLVSQRPSEIEATVLSQCNSWIVLRLTNNIDQSYVLKFLPDSLNSMGSILSSLKRREALIIGQAVSVPSRILINLLKEDQLPKSNDISFINGWQSNVFDQNKIQAVANRWRIQLRGESEGV